MASDSGTDRGEVRRPELTTQLTGIELRRWYWTVAELRGFARGHGVPASGNKLALIDRLAAWLDGGPLPPAAPRRATRAALVLDEPLAADTLIPQSWRCTDQLRAWFDAQTDGQFTFNAAVRSYISGSSNDRTLGDALQVWQQSRGVTSTHIDPQFELNRFTRAWRRARPHADRNSLDEAWRRHRDLPADERARAMHDLASEDANGTAGSGDARG